MKKTYKTTHSREYKLTEQELKEAVCFYIKEKFDGLMNDKYSVEFEGGGAIVTTIDKEEVEETK